MAKALRIVGCALLLQFAASGLRADNHCELNARLTQFHSALKLRHDAITRDSRLLANMARMSPEVTRYFLRGHAAEADQRTLADFAALVGRLGSLGVLGRPDEILPALDLAESQNLIIAADAALERVDCREEGGAAPQTPARAADDSNGTIVESLAAGSQNLLRRLSNPRDLIAIGSLVATALGIAGAIWFIRRKLAEDKRRAKRYRVRATINCRIGGRTRELRLVDISQTGIKIKHDGRLAGSGKRSIVVQIGAWRNVRLHWSNDLYAGGSFFKPLSADDLNAAIRDIRI